MYVIKFQINRIWIDNFIDKFVERNGKDRIDA